MSWCKGCVSTALQQSYHMLSPHPAVGGRDWASSEPYSPIRRANFSCGALLAQGNNNLYAARHHGMRNNNILPRAIERFVPNALSKCC